MEPAGVDPGSLDRLRDIALPPDPSWWPPAPGWVLLALLIMLGGAVVAILLIRRYRRNRYRRVALTELARISTSGAICELPALIRRTALAAFERERIVGLTGDAWLQFLDATAGTRDFTAGAGRHLLDLAYNPGANAATDPDQLISAARTFIIRHRREGP